MKTFQYTYNYEPEMYKYIMSTNILNKKKDEHKIFKALVDAYKWKEMAMECDSNEMKQKYINVSNTLFELFMTEHNNIGKMFKEEE